MFPMYITINRHLRNFYVIISAAKCCIMSVNQIENWNHLIGWIKIDFSPNKTVIELKLAFLLPLHGLNQSPFKGIVCFKCTDAK